jgi:hypothetical protein
MLPQPVRVVPFSRDHASRGEARYGAACASPSSAPPRCEAVWPYCSCPQGTALQLGTCRCSEPHWQLINPSTSPNELNAKLMPHSIIHSDACFAYFNKIWAPAQLTEIHRHLSVACSTFVAVFCSRSNACIGDRARTNSLLLFLGNLGSPTSASPLP